MLHRRISEKIEYFGRTDKWVKIKIKTNGKNALQVTEELKEFKIYQKIT